jgi:hypothetical protein
MHIMAKNAQLVDFLDRAQKVSTLACKLVQSFANKKVDEQTWPCHKAAYEKYRKSLVALASEIKKPPQGSEEVGLWLAEATKNAETIRHFASSSDYRKFPDFLSNLNTVARGINISIKHVRKNLDSVGLNKTDLEEPKPAVIFSSLDRFPSTPNGHISFLEFVRDEVDYAAQAKRQQIELGYSNDTLASMVRGIKWAEAKTRIADLATLPKIAVAQVAKVLKRTLTVGTVDHIDSLLIPAVQILRDALENPEYYIGNRIPDIEDITNRTKATKHRKKKARYATIRAEDRIAKAWKQAREARIYKAVFARDNNLSTKELDKLLDRVYKRNKPLHPPE